MLLTIPPISLRHSHYPRTHPKRYDRFSPHFLVIALLVMVLGGHVKYSDAATELFGFVDDKGVFHFSDAPSDPRYREIQSQARSTRARVGKTTPRRAPGPLARLIDEAARQARIEPALVEAVALTESAFTHNAHSPKGALGLMQLMPATAVRFGVTNPFDPQQNLLGGARYLRELLDRFATLPLALAAYNAGEGAVERHGRTIPPYAETENYVPTVLGHYEHFRSRGPSADKR